jgi:type I restriction enzyme S subunit
MAKPGYKQTEIGEIPEEWEITRLGELAEIVGGSTPSTNQSEYWDGSFPFVTPTDVTALNGKIYLEKTEKKLTEKGRAVLSAKTIPPGSVLFTSRASVGFCAINTMPVVTNQGFANFICKDRVYNLFLYYLLSALKTRFEQLGNGSTFLEVSRRALKRTLIALPPLPEQKKIASALSTVDAAIEKTSEIIEQAKQVKKGLMQELLTRGIGHKKFKQTEIGEIPEEWEVIDYYNATLKDDSDFQKLKTKEYQTMGKYPIVDQGKKLIAGYTNYEDVLYKGELPVIVFGDHTLIVKYIDFNFVVGADGTRIIKANKQKFIPKFLYYVFLSLNLKSEGYKRHFNKLREQLFVCPPLPEQKKIAEILGAADAKIEAEVQKLEQLQTLKKGLMQDLLTGRVRFPEFVKRNS